MDLLFYFLLLAVLTIVGIVLRRVIQNEKIFRFVFLVLAFIVLGSVSAFRYDVGFDYSYIYAPLYEPIRLNPFISSSELVHEPGFVILQRLIALLSSDPQMLFIVTSYLIVGLLMLYFYLHSPAPVVSVFLFISLGQFYCSMNFIRQTLAGVICLFAIPMLMRRKFWPYCALVLLASLFHVSALIMLVFYVVNLIPIKANILLIYVPVAVILYLTSSGLIELFTQFVYGHYDAYAPAVVLGFPVTALAILVFLFLLLFLNQNILTQRDSKNHVYVNYAFFAMVFMFLGVRHSILNRFGLYFEFALPIGIAVMLSEWWRKFPSASEWWKDIKSKLPDAKRAAAIYAVCLVAVFGGSTAIHYHILERDSHGVIPYRTIFDQPHYAGGAIFGWAGGALEEPESWLDDITQDVSAPEPENSFDDYREDET